MRCHKMLFKLFTNSSQSSQRSSALNVEKVWMTFFWPISPCTVQRVKSLEAWLLVLCQVPVDEVMKVQCVMNNVRLRCNEALGASTQLVSLKVTLISGSIGHYTVSVLDGHFPPLF